MDETGKTMIVNQCDNLLQTSASLPEMQMTTTTTTAAEIHGGKHVILAVENNANRCPSAGKQNDVNGSGGGADVAIDVNETNDTKF